MLTVACVLKSGGIYTAEWVAKLRAGVSAHLHRDHRFICLTDMRVPCSYVPLDMNWPGWWSKIELFRLPPPVLYFDLDTLICGDLDDIADAALTAPQLVMLEDFYRPGHSGSGVMAWSNSDQAIGLYRRFVADPDLYITRHRAGGDQEYIEANAKPIDAWQSALPGQFVSYKQHVRKTRVIPDDARVVCLHGKPKFADMPEGDPVKEKWDRAA